MPHDLTAIGLAAGWVTVGLLRASTYGAVLIGAVWVLCRVAPHLPASARALLWWCASLKLLVDLAWLSPIAVPLLPPPSRATRAAPVVAATGAAVFDAASASVAQGGSGPVRAAGGGSASPSVAITPAAIGLGVWVAGVLLVASRMIRRVRRTMAVIARSVPAPDTVITVGADLCGRIGLRKMPRMRVSAEVQTPFVAGLGRPVVVLPADSVAALPDLELRMALCHELAHVKRADTRLGCVPALAEGLFFFHPLAHLAAREAALAREAACDAVVLSVVHAAPRDYGRLLLGLGVARLDAGLAAAGASCSYSNLKRRIAMLRVPQAMSTRMVVVAGASIVAAVLALAPVQLVARTAPGPAASIERTWSVGSQADVRSTAGTPDEGLHQQGAARPAVSQAQGKPATERDLTYVYFKERDTTMMSGSTGDVERARQFRKPGERMLWFRMNGREYVVRDAALLRQVEDIWRPVEGIASEQGKLGAKQGDLGAKQGDLGQKQGEIGTEQGAIGARQGSLGARQGQLASREAGQNLTAAEKADIEKQLQQIDQQMRELDVQMKQLDGKMKAFDQPMRELGEQMKALGKEMDVLGRKMDDVSAKAEAEMKSLLDRAVSSGSAQPVK